MAAHDLADLLPAHAAGRVAAVVTAVHRDLHRCVARYPDLFPTEIFDGSLLGAVAMANTFAAPWLDADRQRLANRAALWTFGLDRWVDGQGARAAEVAALARECDEMVRGRKTSSTPLVRFLAEIHDDLAEAKGYPALRRIWRDELGRLLAAMGRERAWIEAGRSPSVRAYLDNSDSLAFAFVYATHLTAVGTPPRPPRLRRLLRTVRIAQRALRLANDLATHERDTLVGDLNVLALGLSPEAAHAAIADLVRRFRAELLPLRVLLPRLSSQVERQLEYNLAFYAVGDYWAVDPVGR